MARNKPRKQKKQSDSIVYDTNSDVNFALNAIAEKRVGGAINIQGIGFQLLYACFKILRELDETSSERYIRLEGIEDIDDIRIDDNEYIQLKSSINDVDAGTFWNMGVLQNFFEVFVVNQNSKLRLVHNFNISKGKLKQLSENNLPNETVAFWEDKFKGSHIDITKINFSQFLDSIHFEKVSNSQLIDNSLKLLIEKFSLNTGTESQYLKALFYNVFHWSKERTAAIKYLDLMAAIQIVTDSFSKAPINPALKSNWIESVKFNEGSVEQGIGYYEGKAARPIHIAQNLPVRRKEWEEIISKALENFDVTVIKSSSGQGKSTLAWQTSQTFQNAGLSIYELNYCQEWENVAGIVDFIESRLKIGELPLIVIDGLNKTVSQYHGLIVKTAHLPVKYVITTREEDWYRYGLDTSKARMQIVDISLSMNAILT